MRKQTAAAAAASASNNKKTTNDTSNNTSSSSSNNTTKRKDRISSGVDNMMLDDKTKNNDGTAASILPKKGRYKDDNDNNNTSTTVVIPDTTTTSGRNTNVPDTNGLVHGVTQNQGVVQFTFGALPEITRNADIPTEDDVLVFKATIILCKKSTLQQMLSEGNKLLNTMCGFYLENEVMQSLLQDCSGSSKGVAVSSTYVHLAPDQSSCKLYFMIVPDTVTRCNHIWSVHSISDAIRTAVGGINPTSSRIICCGSNIIQDMGSLTAAIARAFPIYTRKSKKMTLEDNTSSSSSSSPPKIHISFMDVSDNGIQESIPIKNDGDHLLYLCESIQLCARLVDMPPEELTTTAYADECRRISTTLSNVTYNEIIGEDLNHLGYGGLYGIGKAASCPPHLIIMEYIPDVYDECIALVGKGIVYDTGGLSLKSKDGMPGMKYDMGGSAGVLGGFVAAVKMQLSKRIILVLCLAENAIGPNAVRNDDILQMYSGKTVEINNTDAEGRLVLADGVAHVSKHYEKDCTLILDMATLTGAQLVAAGKTHAGILANTIELEQRIVTAGLKSGDLVVPLLYAPELLMKEFDSKVADMKNSVKDRGNAQASCAGHFIEAHLHENYKGGWIHVDMAGPGDKDGRGTGYGVALILALLNAPGF